MSSDLVALLYLVAGVLFILALRGLSSPDSSQRGNLFGMTEHDWSRFPPSIRRRLERIRRRYLLVRRAERVLGVNRRSLANDALHACVA